MNAVEVGRYVSNVGDAHRKNCYPGSVVTATHRSKLPSGGPSFNLPKGQTPTSSPALCSTDLQWSCRSSPSVRELLLFGTSIASPVFQSLGFHQFVRRLRDRVRYHFSCRQDENLTHLMAVSNYHVKCPSIENLVVRWDASSRLQHGMCTQLPTSLTKPPVDIQVATN